MLFLRDHLLSGAWDRLQSSRRNHRNKYSGKVKGQSVICVYCVHYYHHCTREHMMGSVCMFSFPSLQHPRKHQGPLHWSLALWRAALPSGGKPCKRTNYINVHHHHLKLQTTDITKKKIYNLAKFLHLDFERNYVTWNKTLKESGRIIYLLK